MSLKVWLPFISNLNNNGLSQNAITSYGTIAYSDSPFGKGLQFNGTSTYVTGNIYTTATMTYMCWVYFDTLRGTHLLDCRNAAGTVGYQPMYINPTSGVQVGGTTSTFIYLPYTFAASTWYHIAVTYSAIKCQLFINGVLTGETTSGKGTALNTELPFTLGCRCSQSNFLHGKINDFRIYDHTCSVKEIAEIAKGLSLHYKLSNVSANIKDCSGYKQPASVTNVTSLADTPRYTLASKFSGSSSYIKILNNTWMGQGTRAFTINLWVYSSTAWNANTHFFSCTESGGFNTEAGNSGYLRFPIHVYTDAAQTTVAYKFDSNELKLADLPLNEWIMLTWVYDSTGTRTYINGELHHTYTNTSYGVHFNTSARLFLGCEASGASPTTPYYSGAMSDFRYYITALNEKQIKELYNESIAIDKSGNTFAREFIEVTE